MGVSRRRAERSSAMRGVARCCAAAERRLGGAGAGLRRPLPRACLSDLVKLVDDDADGRELLLPNSVLAQHRLQHAAAVDAQPHILRADPNPFKKGHHRGEQLELGAHGGLAEDVHVPKEGG